MEVKALEFSSVKISDTITIGDPTKPGTMYSFVLSNVRPGTYTPIVTVPSDYQTVFSLSLMNNIAPAELYGSMTIPIGEYFGMFNTDDDNDIMPQVKFAVHSNRLNVGTFAKGIAIYKTATPAKFMTVFAFRDVDGFICSVAAKAT